MAQEHTIARDIINRLPVGAVILRILAPRGEEPMTGAALTVAVEAATQKAPFSAMYALKNYSPQLVSDMIDEKGRPQDRFTATSVGIKVGNVLLALAAERAPKAPKAGTVEAAHAATSKAKKKTAKKPAKKAKPETPTQAPD